MDIRSDGAPATCSLIADGYNQVSFTIGGASEPNGGLYLMIADDGTDPGSINSTGTPMAPLPPAEDTARYELSVSVRQGSTGSLAVGFSKSTQASRSVGCSLSQFSRDRVTNGPFEPSQSSSLT